MRDYNSKQDKARRTHKLVRNASIDATATVWEGVAALLLLAVCTALLLL